MDSQQKIEVFRHNADHDVSPPIEIQHLAENVGRAAKLVLPEASAQHRHRRGARLVVLRREISSERRLHAKKGKEPRRNLYPAEPQRVAHTRQIEIGLAIRCQPLKGLVHPDPIDEIRVCNRRFGKRRERLGHGNELIGMRVRQGIQQNAVHYRE
jgi:hypothetical protein